MKSKAARIGMFFGMAMLAAPALDRVASVAGHAPVLFAGQAAAQIVPAATFERVQSIIAEHLDVDRAAVTPDADIFLDLGADDLDLIELVMAMEEEFGVELSDDQVEGIVTVGDLAAAVQAGGGR